VRCVSHTRTLQAGSSASSARQGLMRFEVCADCRHGRASARWTMNCADHQHQQQQQQHLPATDTQTTHCSNLRPSIAVRHRSICIGVRVTFSREGGGVARKKNCSSNRTKSHAINERKVFTCLERIESDSKRHYHSHTISTMGYLQFQV